MSGQSMRGARGPVEEPGRVESEPDPGLSNRPLGQIIDVAVLRTLVDGAFELTGIPAAVVDLDGNVLLKSEWQEVCGRFHRSHPETGAACLESDTLPARDVPPGTYCEHRCGNGLWDVSTPLYVAGRRVGNLFVGQFLYEDETVDLDAFRERARRLGFDEAAYLAAVGRVPRWSRERVVTVMGYYAAVAGVLSAVATRTSELGRMLAEKERLVGSLEESEEQYRHLVENLPAGVVVHGPDTRILFANSQACRILGLSHDQLLGKEAVDPAWAFLSAQGRRLEADEYPVSRVIASGEPLENLVIGMHDPASGEDSWAVATAYPERTPQGRLRQVVVSFVDITAQRRAQGELSAIARISRHFQQALPVSTIYAHAAESLASLLRFPSVGIELYDREKGEMVFAGVAGMPGVEPGMRVPVGETLSGVVAATGTACCEVGARAREGYRYESLRRLGVETFLCVPVVLRGEVVGTIALADRVSRRDARYWLGSLTTVAQALAQELARRKAEDALRESEAQLRLAADAADLGIWFNDLRTGRVRGDERARRQFGLECQEVPFEEVLARLHPDDVPLLVGAVTGAVTGAARGIPEDERGSLEYRVLRPDGEVRWLSVFVRIQYAVEGAERRAVAIVGTSQDITARKRAEESQLRTQKLEALGTLAGGVAHDFNNILMAIRGNASLAAAELPLAHPVRELVAEIDRAGLRAVALVRQILAFARPEESASAVVPLGPVVDEALRLLRATLPAEIAIRTTWQNDLPPVAVDAGQVHQAVVNLVTNAAHAIGRRPGRIDLELSLRDVGEETAAVAPGIGSGPHVCLSVRDDGCGMDRATLARAFDPFFTTKRTGEGTGLGLSIVHGIMRAHGGAVELRSKPERGTTVTLYFPAAGAAAEPAPVGPSQSGRRRTERILVVDDDEAIAILSRRSLGRLGYAVTAFTDPGEAVAAFTAAPDAYDAVVTDISMPGMTGFDVAAAILAARPGIPLVITSGYIRPEDEAAAMRLGVKALIAKPDTVDDLAGVLDGIFRTEAA